MLEFCLILNGPPGCGKDTIADIFKGWGYAKHEMKEQIYVDTAKYFSVDADDFKHYASDRILKEEVTDWLDLNGTPVSPRQAIIHVSEEVIKPEEGKDYFGVCAAKRCIEQGSKVAVFSDGGFIEEIQPLVDAFHDLMIVQLHRDGFDFTGDSRSYIDYPGLTYKIQLEDGKPSEAVKAIFKIMGDHLNAPL